MPISGKTEDATFKVRTTLIPQTCRPDVPAGQLFIDDGLAIDEEEVKLALVSGPETKTNPYS